ncbi:MAG: hypothetical protein ACOYXM_07590 [Actinomycetota bacterium]
MTATLTRGAASGALLSGWLPPRSQWPTSDPLAGALAKVADANQKWSEASAELRQLINSIDRVRNEDIRAHGEALAARKAAPKARETALRARIVELERLVPALEHAYSKTSDGLLSLLDGPEGERWYEATVNERATTLEHYSAAVDAVREARRELAAADALVGWHVQRKSGRLRNVVPPGEGQTFVEVLADLERWSKPEPEPTTLVITGADEP